MSQLQTLEKLKRLADESPYEGERQTAAAILKKMATQWNIDLATMTEQNLLKKYNIVICKDGSIDLDAEDEGAMEAGLSHLFRSMRDRKNREKLN